jgi:hypothetical protein
LNQYKVIIDDIFNLKFIFSEGEIEGNTFYLPGFLLVKSIQGVDFTNKKQIVDLLKELDYFTDIRKYDRVLAFKGDDLGLLKFISTLRLKSISLPASEESYLSDFYSMKYLDRINHLQNINNTDKFITDSLYFFKRVLKFDSNTYFKNILLNIRARINKEYLKQFQFFNDKYDIYFFQFILKD